MNRLLIVVIFCVVGAFSGAATSLAALCGDGVVQLGEQCDDGNTVDHDGCDSDCSIGIVDLFRPPRAGEVYKEFTRVMGSGNTWRVTDPNAAHPGSPGNSPADFLPNPELPFVIDDLTAAVRAEARLDIWGGHAGTTMKRFRLNSNGWVDLSELQTTPGDGECWTQQWNLTVDVPLEDLVVGENVLQGDSGGQTCFNFNWGQWGWYSFTVRVYYPSHKPHPTGRITGPAAGQSFGENPTLTAVASSPAGIDRVEFFAYYDGYDTDGDGVFSQYHRRYQRPSSSDEAPAVGHVGTATAEPYAVVWNTSLVPDQPQGQIRLQARIRDRNGVWTVTEEVVDLTLQRTESVRLYKPEDVPARFWVRAGRNNSSYATIPAEHPLDAARSASLAVRTWNGVNGAAEPGQEHSTEINDNVLPQNYGANHYFSYDVLSVPTSWLRSGSNRIRFWSESSHHGAEILWPGPGLIVRYDQWVPLCGDGQVDDAEQCDDGAANSPVAPDACRLDCQRATCGDAVVDSGEECDDGNADNGDSCLNSCREASCGDSHVWRAVEQCDDGNTVGGDGCAADCGATYFCGDGVVRSGEQCDDGNDDEGDACLSDCRLASCGDGALRRGFERCDDGNVVVGDGCSDQCQREPICGDGIVDPGEECDDADTLSGDGCSATCTREPFCGDLVVDPGEACDDGNLVAGDGCSPNCVVELSGPNVVDNGDFSSGISRWQFYSDASANFSIVSGEARVRIAAQGTNVQLSQSSLQLDRDSLYRLRFSGRNTGGDDVNVRLLDHEPPNGALGLNSVFNLTPSQQEFVVLFRTANRAIDNARLMFWLAPYDQAGRDYYIDDVAVEKVLTLCGNGLIETGEDCDDGNNLNNDGCSAACLLEATCGDGVVEGAEACDDANADDDDGCLSTCEVARCGDGFLWTGVEECDDGNAVDGDGCSASCTIQPICGDGNLDPGEQCDDGDVVDTDGCPGTCEIARCGDGFLHQGVEFCDDGNQLDGDGCSASCDIEELCGNGRLDAGEECDDGNGIDGDGCSAVCAVEHRCGDGVLGPGEQCDDGNLQDGDGCSALCTLELGAQNLLDNGDFSSGTSSWSFYSDGGASFRVLGGEAEVSITAPGSNVQLYQFGVNLEADTDYRLSFVGRNTGGDDVTLRAHGHESPYSSMGLLSVVDLTPQARQFVIPFRTPARGESNVRLVFWLAPHDRAGNTYYFDDIILEPVVAPCGNGRIDAGEQCDDGNTVSGDGCSAACVVEAGCGNGIVEAGEECDDGNGADGDGCSAACVVEAGCGNGIVEAGEECDDGNGADGDGCSAACLVEAECGNGIVEAGEECDDGNAADGDGCSAACLVEAECGNGVVEAGEECDDGNAADGDGCSAACSTEASADIVVHLPLDEGGGTQAADASGLGNDGTLVNGARFEATSGDGSPFSVRFDGVNDSIDLGPLEVAGGGLTLAAWFRAESFPGTWRDPRLISKAAGTAAADHVLMLSTIAAGNATRLRARVRVGGSTTTLVAAGGNLAPGVWYHAALTYDGAALRLYLDGVQVGIAPLSGPVDAGPSIPVTVGAQPPGAGPRFFDGWIDDVRILRRALTAGELSGIVAP